MKEKIKYWYEMGMWTLAMVRNAVVKGKITEKDFKDITGEKY